MTEIHIPSLCLCGENSLSFTLGSCLIIRGDMFIEADISIALLKFLAVLGVSVVQFLTHALGVLAVKIEFPNTFQIRFTATIAAAALVRKMATISPVLAMQLPIVPQRR